MKNDIFEELNTVVKENDLSYFHASLYLMKKVEDENILLRKSLSELITAIGGGMLHELVYKMCDEINESPDMQVNYQWEDKKYIKENIKQGGEEE